MNNTSHVKILLNRLSIVYHKFFFSTFLGGGPCDRAPAQCQKTCERLGFNDHSHCIKDEYGSEEFETNNSPYCIYDYTALVWNRVAKLFPIQQLSALCKRVRFRETGANIDLI